jgi:hypothetical protein
MTDATKAEVHLAVGTSGSSVLPAVVYGTNRSACYFLRFDNSLNVVTSAVQIESTRCYSPKIFYVAKTGKFLVVYAVGDAATRNRMTIRYKEITLGATSDVASDSVIVVEDAFTVNGPTGWADMIKFAVDYDSTTGFVALFYRIGSTTASNSDTQKIHGFQAPWF